MEEVVRPHASEKWRMDAYIIRTEIMPLVGRIKANAYWLAKEQKRSTESVSAELTKSTEQQQSWISSLMVATVVFAVLAAILLGNLLVNPLQKTLHAMQDIAQGEGDLTQRLSVSSKDELGQLAKAFNLFVAKMQELIHSAAETSEQNAEAANHMNTVTHNANQNIVKEQREIESVAAAINEMAATVQEISRNASNASEHASKAKGEAEQGRNGSPAARLFQCLS